jgi:hypothetical protein
MKIEEEFVADIEEGRKLRKQKYKTVDSYGSTYSTP